MIENFPLAQLITYSTLTITSIIVAAVSLRFSYRQNFGWEPILIVSTHGLSGGGSKSRLNALIKFEFWNRRTYPLVISSVEVKFKSVELDARKNETAQNNQWYVDTKNTVSGRDRIVVNNIDHHQFSMEIPMKEQSLDAIDELVDIVIQYFDPRMKKYKSITVKHHYHFKST